MFEILGYFLGPWSLVLGLADAMRVIAITGGIGSGKSTVRRMFEEIGAMGVDADELARRVVEPGSEGARRLQAAFGQEFFNGAGRLDRKKMADWVFTRPNARRTLESILHPLIQAAEREFLENAARGENARLAVVEIPLLTERGRDGGYDGVLLVTAPEEIRLSRIVGSGRYTREDAKARMENQVSEQERERIADWIIDNGGQREETRKQVYKIYSTLVGDV